MDDSRIITNLEIVQLENNTYDSTFKEIAAIHRQEIPYGILPLLGENYLSRIYQGLSHTPKSAVWIACETDKIVGFLAGSANITKSYLSLLPRLFFPFIELCIRDHKVGGLISKLFSIILYPFYPSAKVIHSIKDCGKVRSEILAIAVREGYKGHGIGRQLIESFEKQLVIWNKHGYYRVATDILDKRSNNFYTKVGFKSCHHEKLHDLRIQIYLKAINER